MSSRQKKKRSWKYPAQPITDVDFADDKYTLQTETQLHSLERAVAGIDLHVNADGIHVL